MKKNTPILTFLLKGERNKKAFTLVELIIVITILVILATIAFVSFKGYMSDSRDANRLSTLNSIEKGLILYNVKTGNYPTPDTPATISLSGSVISYQGYVGDNVSRNINMNKTPLDPLDNTQYYYATGNGGKGYKLLSYQEGELTYQNIISTIYAIDYSTRNPKVIGKGPAIITDSESNVVTTDIDLFLSNSGTTYKALIDNTISITGIGKDIGGGLQALAIKGGDFAPPTSCPNGFIAVPGNPEFLQPGFCVAKYEMTYSDNATLTTTYTSSGISWTTLAYDANKTPVSVGGNYPIAIINQTQAIQQCRKMGAGYHLITNNEWMTIARNIESVADNWSGGSVGSGGLYRGISGETNSPTSLGCATTDSTGSHSGTYVAGTLSSDTTLWGSSKSNDCDSKRQHKLSNGSIIWDLAGNVWEHVNKSNNQNITTAQAGEGDLCTNSGYWYETSSGPVCSSYGPSPSYIANGTDKGMGYVWNNTGNDKILRRGSSSSGKAGVFTLSLYRTTEDTGPGVGFRCSF